MMRQRPIAQKKLDEVKLIQKYISTFKVVGLAHLEKMPASALQDLRIALRKDVTIHVSKKRLVTRAFADSKKQNLVELGKMMTGITAMLFTNMSPIKLAQYLESKAVKGPAKGGDIAPFDIVVPAGDTKLAPGPIISELSQILKLPAMVKNGTIHVRTDSVTHQKGDIINDKQAQLLSRLNITPMSIKLDFYTAWEDGEILPDEVLHLNVEKIVGDICLGASQALNLAMSCGIITADTIVPIFNKAVREARALALNVPIYIPELTEGYVTKATLEANTIESAAFGNSEAKSTGSKGSAEK